MTYSHAPVYHIFQPTNLSQPGGQDSQLVHPSTLACSISTQYLLKTSDPEPAYIAIRTSGWRTGPIEVLQALNDPEKADGVDPREYSFRLYVWLETGDERYRERLETGMWVASGMRKGTQGKVSLFRVTKGELSRRASDCANRCCVAVIYDAYRIG